MESETMRQPIHNDCPFCIDNEKVEILAEDTHAYVVAVLGKDGNKMPGCWFIIPKRHIENPVELFGLPAWGRSMAKMLALINQMAGGLGDYNISLNVGPDAGRLIPHIHFWVIQRNATLELGSAGMGMALMISTLNDPERLDD